jgi:hypothetical protein
MRPGRLGVNRQAFIKMSLAQTLAAKAAIAQLTAMLK